MAETPTTELVGCEVVSVRDEKVGRIDELFVYGDGGEEGWALVKIGLLGMKTALVPLRDAKEEEGLVRIVYEKDHVKAAPSITPDGDRISDADADRLHRHY